MDFRKFEKATYLEVFLDGTPPNCQVALSQYFVIEALSVRPQIAVPTEEEVIAQWAPFQEAPPTGRPWTHKLLEWIRGQ